MNISKYAKYIGAKYGRLTVIGIYDYKQISNGRAINYKMCECECECGKRVNVRIVNLRSGRTKSCGCLRKYSDKLKKETGSNNNKWVKDYYNDWKQGKLNITELSKRTGVSRQTIYKYLDRIDKGEM